MVDDPGLKTLRDKYVANPNTSRTDPKGLKFGEELFVQGRFGQPPPGLYQPQWFHNQMPGGFGTTNDDVFFMIWKVEEKDAQTRTLAQAREDVIKAWRFQKARDLAQEAARKLQDHARETKGNLAMLKDLAARAKVEPVELGPMSKRMVSPSFNPMIPQYTTFQIPPDKVNFPSDNMVDQMLDMRAKEPGETAILSDKPKAIYYVAVMTSKVHPSEAEFRMVYSRSSMGDRLLGEFESKQRSEYRKELVKQLRADAKVTVTDELKKYNTGGSSGSGGGDNMPFGGED
jgi:hypothetical protein